MRQQTTAMRCALPRMRGQRPLQQQQGRLLAVGGRLPLGRGTPLLVKQVTLVWGSIEGMLMALMLRSCTQQTVVSELQAECCFREPKQRAPHL